MNWYLYVKIAQAAERFDQSKLFDQFNQLGVSQETLDYISSIEDKGLRGQIINQVRKNPQAPLQNLQNYQAPNKIDPYLPFEKNLAGMLPQKAQQWALANLKKLRNSRLDIKISPTDNSFISKYPELENYQFNYLTLNEMHRTNSLEDLLRYNPNFDINSYDISNAYEMALEWHEVMAGKGEGLMYAPTRPDLVVYGPEWNNPKWKGWTIQEVRSENDLAVEGNRVGHCFAPGALVRTKKGYLPIEEISIGDKVVCENGTFREVTKTFKREYSGDIVRFRPKSSPQDILVTPNHEFKVLVPLHGGDRPCKRHFCGYHKWNPDEKHDIAWRNIGELSKDSYFLIRTPKDVTDIEDFFVPKEFDSATCKGSSSFVCDEDILWVFGLYIAEGSTDGNKLSFALSKKERKLAERLIKFFERYGFSPYIRKDKKEYGGLVILVSSRKLSRWFSDWFGSICNDKKLPYQLLNLPDEKVKIVAQGIFDGDGHIRKNVLHQTSPILAVQMAEIGYRLKNQPSISVRDNSKRNRKTSYIIENADIRYSMSNRKNRIAGFWNHKNEILSSTNKYEIEPYSGFVYNLEVDTIHSYVVNNIVAHNCVGSYCKDVEKGRIRVFSLRNPQNEPYVTMQTAGNSGWEFHQIFGDGPKTGNAEPGKEYKAMIKEWFKTLESPSYYRSEENEDLERLARGHFDTSETSTAEMVERAIDWYVNENEYGIENKNQSLPNFEEIYNAAIDGAAGPRGATSSYHIRGVGKVIVEKAINFDLDRMQNGDLSEAEMLEKASQSIAKNNRLQRFWTLMTDSYGKSKWVQTPEQKDEYWEYMQPYIGKEYGPADSRWIPSTYEFEHDKVQSKNILQQYSQDPELKNTLYQQAVKEFEKNSYFSQVMKLRNEKEEKFSDYFYKYYDQEPYPNEEDFEDSEELSQAIIEYEKNEEYYYNSTRDEDPDGYLSNEMYDAAVKYFANYNVGPPDWVRKAIDKNSDTPSWVWIADNAKMYNAKRDNKA